MNNSIKKLKKIVIDIAMLPVYWLSYIIPKNNNLYVFGAAKGKYFLDNSKYLFLHLHQKRDINKKVRKIWLSKNEEDISFLRKHGFESYPFFSLRGIWYMLRASKAFISHNVDDINKYLSGGTEIIQLWHGIPLKKIGYKGDWDDRNLTGKIKKILYKFLPYSYYMMCDKAIAPSEEVKKIYKEAFKYSFRKERNSDNNIIILPYPRWFALSNKFILNKNIFPELRIIEKWRKKFKHIILWLPTHRTQLKKSFKDIINGLKINFNSLNSFCKKNNILFVIKPHFLDINIAKDITLSFENIEIYDFPDPYPLLKFADMIITDYSSVYFDFLILDRPIIFTPFDLKDYQKKVGFYYNYYEVTPGPKVKNYNELLQAIENILKGDDSYSEMRKQVRKKFLGHVKLENISYESLLKL